MEEIRAENEGSQAYNFRTLNAGKKLKSSGLRKKLINDQLIIHLKIAFLSDVQHVYILMGEPVKSMEYIPVLLL